MRLLLGKEADMRYAFLLAAALIARPVSAGDRSQPARRSAALWRGGITQSTTYAGSRLCRHPPAVSLLSQADMRVVRVSSRSSAAVHPDRDQPVGNVGRREMSRWARVTTATLDALDRKIRSVLSENRLITPDRIRGRYDTLEQALLAGTCSRVSGVRVKVVFLVGWKNVSALNSAGHSA